jgi:hypothetical protein
VNTGPSRGDRRIIAYQHRPPLVYFILVNEGHRGRATPEGQQRIALNNPHQSYKVLSEVEMDALLESLENRGFARGATAFVPGDEQYFQPQGVGSDRYRGIVYVEEQGVRRKLLGYRPAGPADVDGASMYELFIDAKALCVRWFRDQPRSEQPMQGAGLPGRSR